MWYTITIFSLSMAIIILAFGFRHTVILLNKRITDLRERVDDIQNETQRKIEWYQREYRSVGDVCERLTALEKTLNVHCEIVKAQPAHYVYKKNGKKGNK